MKPPSSMNRIQLAILLGSLSLLGPFTIDAYLPSFPTIVKDFQTNASLVQITLTASLLGLGAGQLVIGPMSDVSGRRKPLIVFLLFYLLTSVICALAPNIYVLIFSRFIQGFSAAGGIVISRAVVRDLYSGRELTMFFATLMLVGNLGPIIAPVIGGGILMFVNWQGVFIVLACIGLILSVTVSVKLEETLPVERRVPSNMKQIFKNFASLLKDREFAGLAFIQGFTVGGIFAYVSGIPFVYQNIYGVSPQVFSFLFGVNGIGLILGTQMVARVSVISEKAFLRIGLLISNTAAILLFISLLLKASIVMVAVPIFLLITCVGVIGTSTFSLAMETKGDMAGSASAFLGLLPFAIGAITTPLVGIAGEYTGIPMAVVIFLCSFMAFLFYFVLVRRASIKRTEHQIPS